MRALIRLLCAISILCGTAKCFCPEGSGRRALSFVCAVVLMAGFVKGLIGLNWETYALETGQLMQRQEAFLQRSETIGRSLDRTVIERQYSTYILNMAQNRGVHLQEAKVSAQWSLEGLWVPWSVVLTGDPGSDKRELLSAWIEADLGIPRERQEWREHGVEELDTNPS